MKEMLNIAVWQLAVVIIISALSGCALIALLSASSRAEEETRLAKEFEAVRASLQSEIDVQEDLLKHKESAISILTQEKAILESNIKALEQVVQRFKNAPGPSKLLKERIPYGMTNTIRFMDFRKITDKNSIQYKLQQDCRTEQGIRYYDKYICVALGSAYGQDIGDTWHVTLHCGTEFDIILAEFKDDGKTDFFGHPDENYDKQDCINILEFVVDENKMSYVAKKAGTYTALGYYGGLYGNGGNVAKMEYTGRVWK